MSNHYTLTHDSSPLFTLPSSSPSLTVSRLLFHSLRTHLASLRLQRKAHLLLPRRRKHHLVCHVAAIDIAIHETTSLVTGIWREAGKRGVDLCLYLRRSVSIWEARSVLKTALVGEKRKRIQSWPQSRQEEANDTYHRMLVEPLPCRECDVMKELEKVLGQEAAEYYVEHLSPSPALQLQSETSSLSDDDDCSTQEGDPEKEAEDEKLRASVDISEPVLERKPEAERKKLQLSVVSAGLSSRIFRPLLKLWARRGKDCLVRMRTI